MRLRESEALDGFQHCRKPWLVRTLPGIGPEVSGVYHQPTEARKPRQHPQAANDPIRDLTSFVGGVVQEELGLYPKYLSPQVTPEGLSVSLLEVI